MRNGLVLTIVAVWLSSALGAEEGDVRRRNTYSVPVKLDLCKHLTDAIVYEDDVPTSSLPMEKTFAFTRYPEVGVTVPEQVRIEVEARHTVDATIFVRTVTLAPEGERRVQPRTLTIYCDLHR